MALLFFFYSIVKWKDNIDVTEKRGPIISADSRLMDLKLWSQIWPVDLCDDTMHSSTWNTKEIKITLCHFDADENVHSTKVLTKYVNVHSSYSSHIY